MSRINLAGLLCGCCCAGKLRSKFMRKTFGCKHSSSAKCILTIVFVIWIFTFTHVFLNRRVTSDPADAGFHWMEPYSLREMEIASSEWRWQLVQDRQLAVYAAYLDYDDAPALAKHVLVMAVLNYTEQRPLYCHFRFDNSLKKNITSVGPVSFRLMGYSNHPEIGKEVLLQCPVEHLTVKPVAVRVSGHHEIAPNVADERWISVYSVPDKTVKTVWCIGPLYDRYDEAQIVVEQLEWVKLQGIDEVIAYVDSVNPQVMAVLRHYEREGLVKVIDWNIARLINRNVYYLGQLGQLNDCIYRSRHRAQYVLLHDIDERLIVPHQLRVMDKIESIFQSPTTAAAVVRSAFYQRAPKGSSILMHSRMKSAFYPHGVRSKVIVRPQFIETTDIHDITGILSGHRRVLVNERELYLAHFRFETTGIGYSRDDLLPNYVDVMSPPVVASMKKLFGSSPFAQ